MQTHSEIHEGMTVHSRDGQKLGKVVSCDSDAFMIERGFFFPKDYPASYDYVADVREEDVYLSVDQSDLLSGQAASGQAASGQAASGRGGGMEEATGTVGEAGAGVDHPARPFGNAASETTTSIPLSEERLVVEKRVEEAGAVRITKDVVTEQKEISVPVSHEQVRVERVPLDGERAESAGTATFQREETTIPIHQEQVEVRKTPVVTEEVRVSKQQVADEQSISESVRKEVAEVKKEGQIREREVPPSRKP